MKRKPYPVSDETHKRIKAAAASEDQYLGDFVEAILKRAADSYEKDRAKFRRTYL